MLRTHLVEGSLVRPLQHRPKAGVSVRMHIAPHILARAVPHRLVRIRQAIAGLSLVDLLGVHGHLLGLEALRRRLVRRPHYLGNHLLAGAIAGSHHGRLAHRRPTAELLASSVVPALSLAAHVSLVHLHRRCEHPRIAGERLSQSVRHVPGRLLRDAEDPVQFQTRDALQAGGAHVDATAHFRNGMREPCITEPCRTERNIRQSRQRNGSGSRLSFSIVFALPHRGQCRSPACGQRTRSNHRAADSSSGNMANNSRSVIPLR